MNRRQVTPWLRLQYRATSWDGAELVQVDPAYVPMLLRDLEPTKARTLWESDAAHAIGYDAVCKQQEALLMGAREDLIQEIRSLRGSDPFGAALDTDTYPVGMFPGVQLADLKGKLEYNGRTATEFLSSIESILQQQGTGEEGQLAALLEIVALLSA